MIQFAKNYINKEHKHFAPQVSLKMGHLATKVAPPALRTPSKNFWIHSASGENFVSLPVVILTDCDNFGFNYCRSRKYVSYNAP